MKHGSHSGWEPCVQTFVGHGNSNIYAVSFSQDGAFFVTGGGDSRATVWKTATRTPIVSFDGHKDAVNCVAYAPDGLHVASGSADKRVCVWQPSSGECVHTLQGHTDPVWSVAFSGDGRRIVSATGEGEVKLWDTTDGRCLLTLDGTRNGTNQVGFSPNDTAIARGHGTSLSLYDVVSSSSEALEIPDTVEGCIFSPDGRYIAARSAHVIRVWAWPDKSPARSIDVAESLSGRLAFSPDGALVGCGSKDGTVRVWPVASEDSLRTLLGHVNIVRDLAYSPDKSQVVSVADDGMIRVWDLRSSSILAKEHPALESALPSLGPPRFVLVWYGEHAIALLDLPALGIGAEHFPTGTLMPNGALTATFSSDIISTWVCSATAREWELLTHHRPIQTSWRPFAISSDSALMACPSPMSNSVVDVYDLRTGRAVSRLTAHTWDVLSVTFSPNKTRLATGSKDCSVKIWDTTTGDFLCGHITHLAWIRTVAFSPDGRLVASGSYDRAVHIFEITTGRVIRVLYWHQECIAHVIFTADNTHLMALDDSHWVYIYDVESGACIREVSLSDDGWLHSPFFSPDGSGVLVGDGGAPRTVALWNPGTRTWPFYHITRDGWVYALSPGKTQRLCWLPPEWRTPLRSEGSMFYVVEGMSGPREKRRVITLNMSQLLEYVDALDALQ